MQDDPTDTGSSGETTDQENQGSLPDCDGSNDPAKVNCKKAKKLPKCPGNATP